MSHRVVVNNISNSNYKINHNGDNKNVSRHENNGKNIRHRENLKTTIDSDNYYVQAIEKEKNSRKTTTTPNELDDDDNDEANEKDEFTFQEITWLQQCYWTSRKNILMIRRQPLIVRFFLYFGGVLTAFICWIIEESREISDPNGLDDQLVQEVMENGLTECGAVNENFLSSLAFEWNVDYNTLCSIVSLNCNWIAYTYNNLLFMGAAINSFLLFVFIQDEMTKNLLGVLRSLGLRESVYWMSWYLPFGFVAFVNSMLVTSALKILSPSHVYTAVYFGGIFASIFGLHLAMNSVALFLAAIFPNNTKILSTLAVFFLLLGTPWFVTPNLVEVASWKYIDSQQTLQYILKDLNIRLTNADVCSNPLISVDLLYSRNQSLWYEAVNNHEMEPGLFIGSCYIEPDYMWNSYTYHSDAIGNLYGLLFPQLTFNRIWGNFAAYTDQIGRNFTSTEAKLSLAQLSGATSQRPLFRSTSYTKQLSHFPSDISIPCETDQNFVDKEICVYADISFDALDGGNNSSASLVEKNSAEYTNQAGNNTGFFLNDCRIIPTFGTFATLPSTRSLYMHLALASALYFTLAWYLSQVLPGTNGRGQKFYFFLQKQYWFRQQVDPKKMHQNGKHKQNNKISIDRVKKDFSPFDGLYSKIMRGKIGALLVSFVCLTLISVQRFQYYFKYLFSSLGLHLDHKFEKFTALDGLSFEMIRGEVTALLGHNGAGKSTLSSIISCDIAPTDGGVNVLGYSINQDPYAVRQMIGLCRQDNYFWSYLTAKDHLELFAGLRGVRFEIMDKTVEKWLQSVDLHDMQVKSQYPHEFSGGMKRRLSLALATIGDCPVVILDEPTTGMDPISRRAAWQHIEDIKPGRVILLTTHAMDEADVLADKVAIVRSGSLVAFDSPPQLKLLHGATLQFSLLVAKDDVASRVELINNFFNDHKKTVVVEVATSGNIGVKIMKVQQIESDCGEDGVSVELLSEFVKWLDATIESRVVEYSFSNSSLEDVFVKLTNKDDSNKTEKCGSAEINDQSSTSSRPSVDNNSNDGGGGDDDDDVGYMGIVAEDGIHTFNPKLSVKNQIHVLCSSYFSKGWFGGRSWTNLYLFALMIPITYILGGIKRASSEVIIMVVVGALWLLRPLTVWPLYNDRSGGTFDLMRSQGLLAEAYFGGLGISSLAISAVYSFGILTVAYLSPLFREHTPCGNVPLGEIEECNNISEGNFKFVRSKRYIEVFNYIFLDDETGENITNIAIYSSPGGYGYILILAFAYAIAYTGATWPAAFLPTHRATPFLVTTFAASTSLAAISFTSFSWNEKLDSMVVDAIKTQDQFFEPWFYSSSQRLYWRPFPISGIFPLSGVIQCLVAVHRMKVHFESNPSSYVEDFMIPGLDASCKDKVCTSPYAVRYFWQTIGFMFLGSVINSFLGYICARLFVFPSGKYLTVRKRWSNFVAIIRCQEKPNQIAMEENDSSPINLNVVKREEEIVKKIVQPFLKEGNQSNPGDNNDGNIDAENLSTATSTSISPSSISVDYDAIDREGVSPVLMYSLRKVYPGAHGVPPKVALHGLSMHVAKGQVLGLLGENGSGKTTAMKILSGAHEKSSGISLVAGYDPAIEKIQVSERFGDCPQFDVYWHNMSIQEHLEFFGALKGLPADKLVNAARSVASAVGLGDDSVYTREAGKLSGGMRRRLTIAMSLLGAPVVLNFDEPTTGLDPSTRNTVWGLFSSFATPERSIIITTHMMQEAETLCNRVAIISKGRLRAIGTQQELKYSLGDGFLLQATLIGSSEDDVNRALNFATERLHPDATLQAQRVKTLFIDIPRDLKLDRVFRALCSQERVDEGGINHFVLSECPLEAIFLLFGQ